MRTCVSGCDWGRKCCEAEKCRDWLYVVEVEWRDCLDCGLNPLVGRGLLEKFWTCCIRGK